MRHSFLPAITAKYLGSSVSSNDDSDSDNSSTSVTRKKKGSLVNDLIAGTVATILSGPLNYVRNIHYATDPSIKPDSSMKILRDLVLRTMRENHNWFSRIHYLQQTLRIGWGTLRVGCGMAVGSYLYEYFASLLM